jgi:hypothetical protein
LTGPRGPYPQIISRIELRAISESLAWFKLTVTVSAAAIVTVELRQVIESESGLGLTGPDSALPEYHGCRGENGH